MNRSDAEVDPLWFIFPWRRVMRDLQRRVPDATFPSS